MSAETIVLIKQVALIGTVAAIIWAIYRSRRSDIEAIHKYVESKELRVRSIQRNFNYQYATDTLARIYLVRAATVHGDDQQLVITFNLIPPHRGMKVVEHTW